MRISDWSSDVCSSDLGCCLFLACPFFIETQIVVARRGGREGTGHASFIPQIGGQVAGAYRKQETVERNVPAPGAWGVSPNDPLIARSEEHTSELQSLMRISYAVFCLKNKKTMYKQ